MSSQSPKDQASGGVGALTTLIGGAISLALILGAIYLVVIPMLNTMSLNMSSLPSASASLYPDPSWKLVSTVTHQAGASCDDKAHQCPSETKTYTSVKPITPAQIKRSILGSTAEVQGDCQHTPANQPLCSMHFHSATSGFDYDSAVTGSPGNYTVTLSTYRATAK